MKEKKYVYLLQHLHIINDDEDSVKIIGIYETREDALEAIERVKNQPGFKDFPDLINYDVDKEEGFYIAKYESGVDHWTEGFVTV